MGANGLEDVGEWEHMKNNTVDWRRENEQQVVGSRSAKIVKDETGDLKSLTRMITNYCLNPGSNAGINANSVVEIDAGILFKISPESTLKGIDTLGLVTFAAGSEGGLQKEPTSVKL
ncbi:hypothetical protein M231_05846 [Tremella mesenterica]|uniref:Uncharacterized protein n=1 Tax=Tremella mesenterica TaxID=5217 RepID=A0A4Q1BH11_TREME|nr:uncharacterized protein TREMEDRAFT_65585 [Tremella mesenterica DSM 1558]EIW66314.1 hypothetical protein TREMEDRAFT_65585 [Tremella mesenterica DSM 1558]RXK36872.1 hypothetical protein M231_05846 [Tremella mesenterica]